MQHSTLKGLKKEKGLPKSGFHFPLICTVGATVGANPSLPVSSDRQDQAGSPGEPDPSTLCAPLSSLVLLGLTQGFWNTEDTKLHKYCNYLECILHSFHVCVWQCCWSCFGSWIKHMQSGHGCVKASEYENGSSNLVSQISFSFEGLCNDNLYIFTLEK